MKLSGDNRGSNRPHNVRSSAAVCNCAVRLTLGRLRSCVQTAGAGGGGSSSSEFKAFG